MFSDEECEAIYTFLAQTMKTLGLGYVVAEVEQEIEDLESIQSTDIVDLSQQAPTSKRASKTKKRSSKQAPLPGLETTFPVQDPQDPDPATLRRRIYTPQRRALRLINALEFVVVGPVEIGDVIIRSLKQDKILFGDESQNEHAFVLTASDITAHWGDVQSLRIQLEKLRQGIRGEKIDDYE